MISTKQAGIIAASLVVAAVAAGGIIKGCASDAPAPVPAVEPAPAAVVPAEPAPAPEAPVAEPAPVVPAP
jgi:hypothetical protein